MIKNVVVAMDSFKGSLSSMEAGAAVKEGILRVNNEADVVVCPIADGGEGTVEALALGMGGRIRSVDVTGPLGEKVSAKYGVLDDRATAVMEMAMAAGITLVNEADRNPLNTTTYGVGEMILYAINAGCRRFIMGIGGSATNDGGIGMLQALGFGMLDENDAPVPYGALGLKKLHHIAMDNVLPEVSECSFHIACDVTNPLCGENGASAVYGPQKGATPEMVHDMDQWMAAFAELVKKENSLADPDAPGMGAAGGLGFAFKSLLNADLEPGIKIVLKETKLEEKIRNADLVITGEGRLDTQTVMGKAPVGVAGIAKKYSKPVIAFAGVVDREAGICNEHGIDAFFPILRDFAAKEDAKNAENAYRNLADTAEQVFRLINVAGI